VSATLSQFADDPDNSDESVPWCVDHDAEEWCRTNRENGELGCFDHFEGGGSA